MSDPITADELLAGSAQRDTREQFRAELMVQLPELGLRVIRSYPPAGTPSLEYPALDLYDRVEPDHDYDPTALADWVLGYLDAVARTAVTNIVADEENAAATIELATAGQAYTASAEFAQYLTGVAAVIARGMSIKDSTDLAATLQAKVAELHTAMAQIVVDNPALLRLFGEAVSERAVEIEVHQSIPKDLRTPPA